MIRRIITNDVPLFVVSLVVLVLILSACASQPGAVQPPATDPSVGEPTGTPGAVSHGSEVGGYVELVDALRAAGATVEPAGDVDQPFFGDSAQVIKVNGADVQVFEYPDEAARMAESEQISPDGATIGTTMVTWVDEPHFWAVGRTIVLYVGSDLVVLDVLNRVLGEPITE